MPHQNPNTACLLAVCPAAVTLAGCANVPFIPVVWQMINEPTEGGKSPGKRVTRAEPHWQAETEAPRTFPIPNLEPPPPPPQDDATLTPWEHRIMGTPLKESLLPRYQQPEVGGILPSMSSALQSEMPNSPPTLPTTFGKVSFQPSRLYSKSLAGPASIPSCLQAQARISIQLSLSHCHCALCLVGTEQ